MRIAVVNGPNLNLLGTREPAIYGSATLAEIEQAVRARAGRRGVEVDWFQSNHEGAIVEAVQNLAQQAAGFVVNAAALTHSSLALRDALLAVNKPFVEVHLSNIFAREPERRKTVLADIAVGLISGFGQGSYLFGVDALLDHLGAE